MNIPTVLAAMSVLAILEAVMQEYLRLFGVGPELLLVSVLYFGFNSTKARGALWGFAGGILKAAFSGMHPLVAIIYASVGFTAGFFKEAVNKELPLAQAVYSSAAVISSGVLYGLALFSPGLPFHKALFQLLLPSALYTALLAPPAFVVLEFLLPPTEMEYKEIIFKKRVFEGGRPQ